MKLFLALFLAASAAHASAPPYTGISQPANGVVTQYLSGNLCIAASSASAGTCNVNANGAGSGSVTAGAGNFGGTDVLGALDFTDLNSLVLADMGNPAWLSHFSSTQGITARKYAGSDGTYQDMTELNYSSTALATARRAYMFVAPPGATSVTMTVPTVLPPGGSNVTIRASVANANNVDINAENCLVTGTYSPSSCSFPTTIVAGSTYIAQVILDSGTYGQPDVYVGQISLSVTGGTGLFASAFKHLQVQPSMVWDDALVKWGQDAITPGQKSRFVFDTTASTLMADVYFTGTPIISGNDRAMMAVYVNDRLYSYVTPTSTTQQIQFLPTITLPAGLKRVALVASTHYGTAQYMYLRSVFAPATSVLQPVLPPTNRRVIVYGDSIASGDYASTTTAAGWTSLLRGMSGYSVALDAYAGRGLINDFSSVNGFYPMIKKWAKFQPTDIWLAIGTNDYGLALDSAPVFGTMYSELLDEIHKSIPTARVWAQSPIYRWTETANSLSYTMPQYRVLISSAVNQPLASGSGATRADWANFVDGTTIVTSTGSTLLDGVHPNNIGHGLYAEAVYGILASSAPEIRSPAAQEILMSTANQVGQLIRGADGQTVNYRTIVSSAGAVMESLDQNGQWTIPGNAHVGTIASDGTASLTGISVGANNLSNPNISYLATIQGSGNGVYVSTGVTVSSFTSIGATTVNSLTVGTTTNILNTSAASLGGENTATNTSFSVCMGTLTVTTHGGPVLITATFDASNNTLNDGCYAWILQDGAFINGAGGTIPNAVYTSPTANAYNTLNYSQYVSAAPSSGTHYYCLGVGVRTGGTCSIGQIIPTYLRASETR